MQARQGPSFVGFVSLELEWAKFVHYAVGCCQEVADTSGPQLQSLQLLDIGGGGVEERADVMRTHQDLGKVCS